MMRLQAIFLVSVFALVPPGFCECRLMEFLCAASESSPGCPEEEHDCQCSELKPDCVHEVPRPWQLDHSWTVSAEIDSPMEDAPSSSDPWVCLDPLAPDPPLYLMLRALLI